MEIQDLIDAVARHWIVWLTVLGLPPVIAGVIAPIHGRGQGGTAPWKYLYSVVIYATAIPGMFAFALTAYALLIARTDLLKVNVLVYFVPIGTTVVTVAVMRRNVNFEQIPGFDRLSGLMLMLGLSFLFVLVIMKTRIWLFFGASIWVFFGLLGAMFALLKWGTHLVIRKKN